MPVMYGLRIDREEIDSELDEKLMEFDGCDNERQTRRTDGARPMFHTGYSVSAFEPMMAVLGYELSHMSTLFNPVPLSELTLQPSEEQVAGMVAAMKELNIGGKLDVYVFENDDD